jgi:hypothetical protein
MAVDDNENEGGSMGVRGFDVQSLLPLTMSLW